MTRGTAALCGRLSADYRP